jgi:glycosyltransferase involved in cell wall biosynthesis
MKISIVMPTYNGLKYIKEAIDSVLAQNFTDWELIISDDGSKDGTRDYLKGLTDPRIKAHLQRQNLGIFGNLNFLFKEAQAELTQILCQDDYLLDPDALGRVVGEWAKQAPDIAFMRLNHGADSLKSDLAQFERQVLPAVVTPEFSDLYFYIFGCIPGNLSNVTLRTRTVADHGWFSTSLPYAGDFEFWSRVGHRAKWGVSTTRAVHVRQHQEQASVTLNKQGELLPQLTTVLTGLYQNLIAQGHSPAKLRKLATISYIAQHRYAGVRLWMRGGGAKYIALVDQVFGRAVFSLPFVASWGAFFMSLGGKVGRIGAAQLLLANTANRAERTLE